MDTEKAVQTDEDRDGDIMEILPERSGSKCAAKNVSARKKKKKIKKKRKAIVSSEIKVGRAVKEF